MAVRHQSSVLLLAVLVLAAATSSAVAAVDVTGRWGVVMQSGFIGPQPAEWDFEQTGTTIVLTVTFTGPDLYGTVGPYSGTIDPATGVFHIDLPDDNGFPFPPCPDSRIDGTATSGSIGGDYADYFIKSTPPDPGCQDGWGPFNGAPCGIPGVPGCCTGPSCCGNGVIADGEECDDGNQIDGDCCSATCQAEPAGSPCSDANVCTDDLGCDGTGACEHVNNSASCGSTCHPGTCSGGLCNYAAPLPDGAPCDDSNACTAGDHCDGTGSCTFGGAVTCGPCESCSPSTGCAPGPESALVCDTNAPSDLALSVANPARSRVFWHRKDAGANPGLTGNPTASTEYDLCVFDAAGLLFGAAVLPGGTCDGQACWGTTDDGYRYRDRDGTSGGVKKIDLRGSGAALQLKVKAQGPNILPASLVDAAAPLLVELRARDPNGNACWQSRFDESSITRGTRRLRAKN